jgi:hypothetical protein
MTPNNWIQALGIVCATLFGFAGLRVFLRLTNENTLYWFRCRVCGARWNVEDPMFIQAVKTHDCEETP